MGGRGKSNFAKFMVQFEPARDVRGVIGNKDHRGP